ncbi:hypothetical protein NC653_037915 [Populus alba x Populus x berolinensis]|uniref:Uncharacterized protein n=1 Tax=Populus alba x Populus x berolinensis TaxID=444605 RepID=A0AAD6PSK8_9ROSI|nr:hypothetical protein NC653_037913 [Populus alba x Populus x berolinensis]KAJ6959701.1 hypothetical protein NC653_037915 [Populus alba x Populus x berolinensis]
MVTKRRSFLLRQQPKRQEYRRDCHARLLQGSGGRLQGVTTVVLGSSLLLQIWKQCLNVMLRKQIEGSTSRIRDFVVLCSI